MAMTGIPLLHLGSTQLIAPARRREMVPDTFRFEHPTVVATACNSPPPERSEPVPYLDPVPPGGGLGVGATGPSIGPIPLAQPLTFDGPHLRVFRAHLVRTGDVPLLRAPEYGSAPVGL